MNTETIIYNYNGFLLNFFKTFFICQLSLYTALRLSHLHHINNLKQLLCSLSLLIFSFVLSIIIETFPQVFSAPIIILFLFILFLLLNDFKLFHSAITTLFSLSLNYIIYFASTLLVYATFKIFNINNNLNILLPFVILMYISIILHILNFKRLKYGITFINNLNNENLDLIILNVSVVVLMLFIFLPRINYYFTVSVTSALILFSVLMAITIYKSFSLYYKHNLLVKELNDTKLELEKKDKEIERLEKENLEFSKTSHSIAHKQRVLEYKLNQLQLNTEFTNELNISDKLKEISDTYSSNVTNLTLPKTGIENIDDILEYMQSECTKNNINFELQLNGDIFSMVTTVINKEKLEILLADHIKNAIIAINSSENINKSILVRLGLINDIYSIYFYDSGIEFDENVLSSLGKEQITTHKDIGGTGCGFLNTFDTLKEFNASLEINEISSPCKDNYTKSIVIKFDGKNDFTINSYKKQE